MIIVPSNVAAVVAPSGPVSFVGATDAGTLNLTSISLPSHVAGDIILMVAGGSTYATPPASGGTVPVWTEIGRTISGATSAVLWYAVATSSSTTSGSFSTGQKIAVMVFRNQSSSPIGGFATGSSNGGIVASVSFPAITMQDTSGRSQLASFTITGGNGGSLTLPGGYTRRTPTASSPNQGITKDTTTADGQFSATISTARLHVTFQVEIK